MPDWKVIIYTVLATLVVLALFNIGGLFSQLAKAFYMIIQQLCSTFLTVFFVFFRIFNALELYIVLLIDVLTGRRSALSKVTTLAISALSVASYYTTFTGMLCLVDGGHTWAAGLITVGVQTFLLVASLEIGSDINLNRDSSENKTAFFNIKNVVVFIFAILAIGTLIKLILSAENETMKNVLYLLIFLVMIILFAHVLNTLIDLKSKRKFKSKVLICLYFVTLSFSSFFSYNSFMNFLYSDKVRCQDSFLRVKASIIHSIDGIYNSVDGGHYADKNSQLLQVIKKVKVEIDSFSDETTDYGSYKKLNKRKKEYQREIEDTKKRYDKWINSLVGNEGNDFGLLTSQQVKQWQKERKAKLAALRKKLARIKKNIKQNENYSIDKRRENNRKKNLKFYQEKENYTKMINLLEKERWSEDDLNTYENQIDNLMDILEIEQNSNLTKQDITKLHGYKNFEAQYQDNYQEIIKTHLSMDESLEKQEDIWADYEKQVNQIFAKAYNIAEAYPVYNSEGYHEDGNKTENMILLERAYRASNQRVSELEKNIKAFVESKFLALLSALIAVLMDCLILFVGLLTPQPIEYFREQGNYAKKKKKAIMEHLFNKPVVS